MAQYNVSPVREQIRNEIRAALADGAARSASELYGLCPSATESMEIARIAHDMRRTGQLDVGEQVIHPLGMRVNTYRLPTAADPRLAAAKPITVERKIPRTVKPPKPAPDHPFNAPIVAQEGHDALPRTTRPLPMHLTTLAPQQGAEGLGEIFSPNSPNPNQDENMSEDSKPYIVKPPFALETNDPEEDSDAELVDALKGLAERVPLPMAEDDDPAEMAAADVGKRKSCQCLKLPPLPNGYIFGGIRVWIEAEHDVGRLAITTHDEGGGAFCSLKASGQLSFDPGELLAIGNVADALVKLHESMESDHE